MLEQQSQLATALLLTSQPAQPPSAAEIALVRQKAEAVARTQTLRLEKLKADQKGG